MSEIISALKEIRKQKAIKAVKSGRICRSRHQELFCGGRGA
jgi:hypothetical protein